MVSMAGTVETNLVVASGDRSLLLESLINRSAWLRSRRQRGRSAAPQLVRADGAVCQPGRQGDLLVALAAVGTKTSWLDAALEAE